MANNIFKDIIEPETAASTEFSVEAVTPNITQAGVSAAPPPNLAIPPPETILPSPEERAGRKQQSAFYGLRGKPHQPGPNDWKKTVGMFINDLEAKETAAEGRRIRESEKT